MNFSNRGPLGLKTPKAKKDPAYLARVAGLPCCICEAFGEHQTTPTQVHHVIHGRLASRKTPDRMAIPLCWHHHQGPMGVHTVPEAWREAYGQDHDFTAATQDKLGV